jgi:hypothetical protein
MSEAQHDVFIGQVCWNQRQVGARIRHEQVSAQAPLIVLPKRQPPMPPPHCEWTPFRQ